MTAVATRTAGHVVIQVPYIGPIPPGRLVHLDIHLSAADSDTFSAIKTQLSGGGDMPPGRIRDLRGETAEATRFVITDGDVVRWLLQQVRERLPREVLTW